MTVCEDKTKNH